MARLNKEQKKQVKKRIIDNATILFLKSGYDETSTKKIAKLSNIAEGTLFNYFDTKADLLMEVIENQYFDLEDEKLNVDYEKNIVDVYMENYYKYLKRVLFIPKKIMIHILSILIKSSSKSPKRLKKYAEIDFILIRRIADLTKIFISKGILKSVDPNELAEIIYGSFFYEFTMYLYEEDYRKEDLEKRMRKKVEIILNGYIIKD